MPSAPILRLIQHAQLQTARRRLRMVDSEPSDDNATNDQGRVEGDGENDAESEAQERRSAATGRGGSLLT